ncbi:hypothetical protein [Aminivibrio sp.]|uniref:hypothetical protein n=1 Tax=Aminivibrio sp. TaxID=1872489 RepID=UPI003D974A2F
MSTRPAVEGEELGVGVADDDKIEVLHFRAGEGLGIKGPVIRGKGRAGGEAGEGQEKQHCGEKVSLHSILILSVSEGVWFAAYSSRSWPVFSRRNAVFRETGDGFCVPVADRSCHGSLPEGKSGG